MNYSKCRVFAVVAAVMLMGSLAISASAANPDEAGFAYAVEVDADVLNKGSEQIFVAAIDPESIDDGFAMEARFDEVGVDMSNFDLSVFDAELAPTDAIDPAPVAFVVDIAAN